MSIADSLPAMTPVTGLPPAMADCKDDVTPMLAQYVDLCEQHPDALVLFQVGDFYEAFCEAAEEVARVCEVTLTQREDSTGEYPMAGIPIDNAASYLEALVDADYRVALAEQVEDAEEASGLVDRAVTRVITPGTVVEDELLAAGSTTYVASVVEREPDDESDASERKRDGFGIAAVDASTGECFVTTVPTRGDAREELDRVQPNELLVGTDAPTVAPDGDWMETEIDAAQFDREVARDRLSEYVADPDHRIANDAEGRACGAVLAYAEYTQGDDGPLEYVSRVRRHDHRDQLRLDAAALRSLELFDNRGAGSGATVFDVLDETASALGRRCLDRWLRRPLVDREEIEARLDAIDALVGDGVVRSDLHDRLGEAYDLERLAGRISRERANARDLRALHTTLSVVPELKELIADSPALSDHHDRLDELRDVATLIDEAIRSDPPMELTEGGVINQSFDDDLDELRTTEQDGREWVADLEAAERERTEIDSLSVGHNEVHGYYIEVTNPNLDSVPDDYTRRQTLKNAERFYTPELKEREDEILGAAERADSLEYELFCEVRETVAAETDRIQALATAIAELDALCSLAITATENDYVRPDLQPAGSDPQIEIHGGRHPVVETTQEEFVPNDTDLDSGGVAIITGPNMSGKSTYMRQVALCCLLAQTGSFVPAEAAELPVLDRIFTRVGASDDIAGGESTFMREMSELTDILHDATDRSLVLLDEVGRGTSTADGLAIAQATTEFIHDELDALTLFATHYHGLTDLADERAGVHNLQFAATREGDDVTFLHRVAPGASSASYGIEVARMAGVPAAVVDRAREVVATTTDDETAVTGDHEAAKSSDERERTDELPDGTSTGSAATDGVSPADGPAEGDGVSSDEGDTAVAGEAVAEALDGESLDAEAVAAVASDLRDLDIATMTPLEALTTLDELRSTLADE